MPSDQDQLQIDDAELDALRQHVRYLMSRHREQNTMVRLFDVMQQLHPLPQLLDELATLRAENKTLRARLGEERTGCGQDGTQAPARD